MKIISTIKKNPFAFSVIILLLAFGFSHLPYFLWMNLPEVMGDSFDYFNAAYILLHHPVSDLGLQPIEFPLGYPLFLMVVSWFSSKLVTVVLLQSLIHLSACIYLAYVCCKYYRHYGVLVAVALGIYLMNGFTLRWDTCIYTESLYSSSLIILSALLIQAIYRNSPRWYVLLGIWLFVPEFLRPNGVYVYFIIPALFLFFYVSKQSLSKYMAILLPCILLNLGWAAFNTKAYGAFIPGNFIRFSHVMRSPVPTRAPNPNKVVTPVSKASMLKEYLTLPPYPQFYYSLWATRYTNMYVYNQVTDSTYKMYDWTTPIPDSLRQFAYKEYYAAPDRFAEVNAHVKEHHGIRGLWLTAYHLWYKVDEILLRNRLWFVLFAFIFFFSAFKWCFSGFRNPVYLLFTLLGGLHFISIFVVTFTHSVAQLRYTQVSEFIIYVIFALLPVLIKENRSSKAYAE